MSTHNLGPPPSEKAGPLREGRPDLNTQTVTAERLGASSIREASDNSARSAPSWPVAAMTGCPAGCGYVHECGIGEPVDHDLDKYIESGLFVSREGGVRLISLRQHRERVAR